MFVRGNECIEQTDDETIEKECKQRNWNLQQNIRRIRSKLNLQENIREINDKIKLRENLKKFKDKIDLDENIREVTDRINQKKQLEMNRATRSWIGIRRRVKKWRFVEALRIKKQKAEEIEQIDGKVYLKSPRGKSKIYTFRKPSLR